MARRSAAVAANRFGLGARPGDLAMADPVGWVNGQLGRSAPMPARLASLPSTAALVASYRSNNAERREVADAARDQYRVEAAARTLTAVTSDAPVRERLVRFWSNHFTVSATKGAVIPGIVGAYEREAIRPNLTGPFVELLLAVVFHPAMLVYLDQARSVGPESPVGQRREDRGLNENLARELLELHTLGVDGGYQQADVEALAQVLTGLSVDRDTGRTEFVAARHQPGAKVVLGRTWAPGGEDEIRRVLSFLAMQPATARHVCTKLARHFIEDDPPDAVVDHLADVWARTSGDLGAVTRALVARDEAWEPEGRKVKTPEELVISAARALTEQHDGERLVASLRQLGQEPWSAPSPAGWPDVAPAWTGADAVLRRVQWAEAVQRFVALPAPMAASEGAVTARAEAVLGDRLSARTREALRGPDAVAMLIASPEFQRR
jgi:uncharacterized protein (DUF1800 family)